MADKREPCLILLLGIPGKPKRIKIELFNAWLWPDEWKRQGYYRTKTGGRYRVRVKGKWFVNPNNQFVFLTKTEAKNIIFKSIKLK